MQHALAHVALEQLGQVQAGAEVNTFPADDRGADARNAPKNTR